MAEKTPKSFRLHIGLFGRRNVGKSSILNAITRQNVSIVSDIAGTTTDPVEKPMELLPLGPVLFIDTAGLDDAGTLGELRVSKTKKVFDRTDLGVIITDGEWGEFEEKILERLTSVNVPVIAVFNKIDQRQPSDDVLAKLRERKIPAVRTAANSRQGIDDFRQALLDNAPADFINNLTIIGDIVKPWDTAVLVVPIDKEAPKGRIILPQVQVIRDLLDVNATAIVVKENQLREAIANQKTKPVLVVTDSQAFAQVVRDTPKDIPVTSFSILFARFKGDLAAQSEGTAAIGSLKPGDNVLVAEACSHHPIGEDIGRVKIPAWLNKRVGGELNFSTVQGHDFPEDLTKYKLVIHCGACMWNRRAMLSRVLACKRQGVPITNYGLVIAYTLGILDRALEPFPQALEAFRRGRDARQ